MTSRSHKPKDGAYCTINPREIIAADSLLLYRNLMAVANNRSIPNDLLDNLAERLREMLLDTVNLKADFKK